MAHWPQLPAIELPPFLEFLKLKSFPLKVYPAVYDRPRLTKDTLYIYGPGWRNSWASFDVECLQIQVRPGPCVSPECNQQPLNAKRGDFYRCT